MNRKMRRRQQAIERNITSRKVVVRDGQLMETRTIRMHPEGVKALLEQREAFRAKFGRDPGPNDPVFFDPDKDTPTRMEPGRIGREMAQDMRAIGTPEHFVRAFEKTGLILTPENMGNMTEDDVAEWNAAVEISIQQLRDERGAYDHQRETDNWRQQMRERMAGK
jgi:hypothetical protein